MGMCVCVCVCIAFVRESWKYSTSSLAPAPWKQCIFCSCPTAFNERHMQLWHYPPFPKAWNAGSLIVWCRVSKYWWSLNFKTISNIIFPGRSHKPLLCWDGVAPPWGLSCHRKGPLIPSGGTSKLFVRVKHECKLSTREPGQSAKSNSVLCRTL